MSNSALIQGGYTTLIPEQSSYRYNNVAARQIPLESSDLLVGSRRRQSDLPEVWKLVRFAVITNASCQRNNQTMWRLPVGRASMITDSTASVWDAG